MLALTFDSPITPHLKYYQFKSLVLVPVSAAQANLTSNTVSTLQGVLSTADRAYAHHVTSLTLRFVVSLQ